jgi:hypothetical protein
MGLGGVAQTVHDVGEVPVAGRDRPGVERGQNLEEQEEGGTYHGNSNQRSDPAGEYRHGLQEEGEE